MQTALAFPTGNRQNLAVPITSSPPPPRAQRELIGVIGSVSGGLLAAGLFLMYVPSHIVKSLTLRTTIDVQLVDIGTVMCATALIGLGVVFARYFSIPAAELFLRTTRRHRTRREPQPTATPPQLESALLGPPLSVSTLPPSTLSTPTALSPPTLPASDSTPAFQ